MEYIDKISVIIPVYNVEKYLKRCLDSVLSQTYKNIEIILIDDGSTDCSGSICDEFMAKHLEIMVIHKKNEGLGLTRNVGIINATGKYIIFLDSDDCIQPNHIENLYKDIKQNNADICYCGFTLMKKGEKIENPNPFGGRNFINDEIRRKVVPRMCGKQGSLNDDIQMSSCMAMYRTDIIRLNHILFYSERIYVSEDFLFNLNVLNVATDVYFSSDISYMYYYNENSLSHSYLPDRFEKSKLMMKEAKAKTREMKIYELCKQRIENQFIIATRLCIQAEQAASKLNGRKKAYENIKKIVNDSEVRRVFKQFDPINVRFQARIINELILYKWYIPLWTIMWIRNKYDI